ncbi:proton-coupled folate transporter-like [Littorina saxatilis]
MSNAAIPVTRAILSKMAGSSKQGALFASIAVTETLCALASNTLYNTVYEATVVHVRGAVFFFVAGVIVLNFLLILVFMRVSAGYSLLSEELQSSMEPDIQTSHSGEFTKGDNRYNRR